MLFVTSHGIYTPISDEQFKDAAALAYEFMRENLNTTGPSLPPWVAFVGGAPRRSRMV